MAIDTRVECNHFAVIAGDLTRGVADVATASADAIGRTIEATAPVGDTGQLGDTVKVVPARSARGRWLAGVRLRFYWFWQEYGSSRQPARPFVHPAVELERGPFLRRLTELFERVPR